MAAVQSIVSLSAAYPALLTTPAGCGEQAALLRQEDDIRLG